MDLDGAHPIPLPSGNLVGVRNLASPIEPEIDPIHVTLDMAVAVAHPFSIDTPQRIDSHPANRGLTIQP